MNPKNKLLWQVVLWSLVIIANSPNSYAKTSTQAFNGQWRLASTNTTSCPEVLNVEEQANNCLKLSMSNQVEAASRSTPILICNFNQLAQEHRYWDSQQQGLYHVDGVRASLKKQVLEYLVYNHSTDYFFIPNYRNEWHTELKLISINNVLFMRARVLATQWKRGQTSTSSQTECWFEQH